MEYIKINENQYECEKISVSEYAVAFKLKGKEITDVVTVVKNATSLTIGDETNKVYGKYPDVKFESATVYADESIEVVMHIPSEVEKRLDSLDASQADQDESIAEIMYGGES